MNTWKVILATMVIFGTGVVTGALLVRQSQRVAALVPPPGAALSREVGAGNSPAAGSRLELLRRLQRELSLTPEQRERVDLLLKESQERSRKIMEPVNPAVRAEVQRTKEAFRELLTPEQQARFDEAFKRASRFRDPHRRNLPARAAPTNAPAE